MPLDGPAQPRPKATQLARGEKRYRRFVASPKQWQAIHHAKIGPCRVCGDAGSNGRLHSRIQMHHVVARGNHAMGDDYADNIVPLCPGCHQDVELREAFACQTMLSSLTDAEYRYAVCRAGADYFERHYGIAYTREVQR